MKDLLHLLFLLLPFLFTTQAFAQSSNNYIEVENIVKELKLRSKGKMPYGFKAGTSKKHVQEELAHQEVYKEEGDFIIYTVYFSKDQFDFGDITYEFENEELIGGSLETYFGSREKSTRAFNLVKDNYIRLYGPGEYIDESFEWTFKRRKRFLKVVLTEIEFEGDHGFVVDYNFSPK